MQTCDAIHFAHIIDQAEKPLRMVSKNDSE